MTQNKNLIPIFFSVDDNYAPLLGVAINSMIANADKSCKYAIYILTDGLSKEYEEKLSAFACDNVTVEFVGVADKLDRLLGKLHLRDYYSKATYYRFFIPALFPQYDKGIYLDCDITVNGDISKLFRLNLGHNLIGGVKEDVMPKYSEFTDYVESVLSLGLNEYVNAGVLLMNLCELRSFDIENKFADLLCKRAFKLTQDQDYLNVLCRNRVLLINRRWNTSASPDAPDKVPFIAHYKIMWRPWHHVGIKYENEFWQYANGSHFESELKAMLDGFTDSDRQVELEQFHNLRVIASNEVKLYLEECKKLECSCNSLAGNLTTDNSSANNEESFYERSTARS